MLRWQVRKEADTPQPIYVRKPTEFEGRGESAKVRKCLLLSSILLAPSVISSILGILREKRGCGRISVMIIMS